MWITIDQIECFQAVIDEGSLSAASQKIGKAKSAIRYSIEKLEDQLGFPLFHRGKYRLELTAKGSEFKIKSVELIKAVDSLKHQAQLIASGVESSLRISCTELFPINEVNAQLKKVVNKYPNTSLTFTREILSGVKLLRRGDTDLSIFESPMFHKEFECKKIATIQMVLTIANNHPFLLRKKTQQTFKELIKYPQIVQKSTIADDESVGVHQDAIRWSVTDTATKKQIIKDGLGWGRMPLHEVQEDFHKGKLFHLKHLKDDHAANIYLGRKKNFPHGVVNQYLWNLF